MSHPLSVDAAPQVGVDPHASDRENVCFTAPLAALAARCSDPLYSPSVDELPLPQLDVDLLVDRLQRHYGSDVCAPQQLLLLAERIARRNNNIVVTVLARFRANGVALDEFLAAANAVIDAYESRRNDSAIRSTLGEFLALARKAGLTPAQACTFGRFDTELARQVTGSRTGAIYDELARDSNSSYVQIASRCGVDERTVRRVVASWGDPCRDARFRADLPQRIRELHNENPSLSVRALAARIGCGKSTVARVLSQ